MSTWGICMVKDEADVIETTIRHMSAQGLAGIIVLDNNSTDGTTGILETLADDPAIQAKLVVQPDPEVGYWQAQKMTAAATAASKLGAEWVIPFDADEVWTHDSGRPLADVLANAPASAGLVMTRLYNYYVTAVDPDAPGLSPFQRMGWRSNEPQPLGKIIVRWRDGLGIQQGNHGVGGVHALAEWSEPLAGGFEVRHFPYRSEDQFVRKAINGAAAYAATDLPFGTGQHWREYGMHYERGGEAALRAIFGEHFRYTSPSSSGLVYDPPSVWE